MAAKTNADLQAAKFDEANRVDSAKPYVATRRVILMRSLAAGLPPGRLLDIGCSDGRLIQPLEQKHDLFGIDVSPYAVQEANARGVQAIVADVEGGIPYPDESFDIITAGETIEHLVRTDYFLHEVNRVLRVGGHFIVTTPNVATPLSLLMMTFLDLPPHMSARYRSPHVRDFTCRTLRLALSNHGFKGLRVRGTDIILPYVGAAMSAIAYVAPRLSSELVCIAVKSEQSIFEPNQEIEFNLAKLCT